MSEFAIDSNVLIVASDEYRPNARRHPEASWACVRRAIDRLEQIKATGRVLLDTSRLVVSEYENQCSYSGQPGAGDAFLKWLSDHEWFEEHCHRVDIHVNSERDFDEFPNDPDLAKFDRSDRKFAALAIAARPSHAAVLNAVDSDWWEFRDPLARNGIEIEFVCPDYFAPKST